MKLINYLFNKIPLFTALLAGLALSSCGSYQYVGQSSDGIYQTTTENVEQETVAIPAENNNDYYSNYFKEKALEAEIYNDSDDVFTDIESYQGSYDETLEETNQNAGWGTSNETVVINIHDNGFYNNYGWAYNNWGWNNWGWNRPWGFNRFGWNSWNSPYAWNYGWGYSGFYNSYWNNPYYGHGYGYGYAYHNGFRRRGIAYNTGRRGSYYRNNAYLNSRSSRINTRNNSVRPRTRTNTTRPRTNTTRPRTNTTRPRTNTTRPRTNSTRPRTNTTRPRTNSSTPRSNSSTPRSSSPSRSTPRSRSTSSGSSRRGRG
ncbi:hypothetical protein DZC78_06590 [Olleya aquimaris]|nr:hypothetical protein DZC78_06590 [Olleya aquimaris]